MTSNCSLHRLAPLDPALDPAYRDGTPPTPVRINHAGELDVELPVARMPAELQRQQTVSFEWLEEILEREAEREERA
jgi:hypothetical protein